MRIPKINFGDTDMLNQETAGWELFRKPLKLVGANGCYWLGSLSWNNHQSDADR